jgi:hypothetical protein
MIRIDIDTMWAESDLAVLGTVSCIENSVTGGFYRIVEIKVESYYISPLEDQTVRVRIEGGEFGELGIWVEDQADFEIDEYVFVFLEIPEAITGDYGYEVFGMYQGKWSVMDSIASQGASRSFEIPLGYDYADSDPEIREMSLFGVRSLLVVAFFCVLGILFIVYRILKR